MAQALADRWVPAVNYRAGRVRTVRVLVVHTTEALEVQGSAFGTARYFAGQPKSDRGSSAHFCIDANEVVQCVALGDTAWAAPGCNADGIQLEHAGKAGQSAAGWDDEYSVAVLARSAVLARALCQRYGIPARHLSDAELAAGARGLVGHDQVSRVYRRSDHTDPGPHFPWDRYVHLINASPLEDDMPTADEIIDRLSARLQDKADIAAQAIATAIASRAWTVGWPAGTQQDPHRVELAQDRLVAAARGTALAADLDQIIGMLRAGQPATLDQSTLTALADSVAARVGVASGTDPQALAAAVADLLAARLKS